MAFRLNGNKFSKNHSYTLTSIFLISAFFKKKNGKKMFLNTNEESMD